MNREEIVEHIEHAKIYIARAEQATLRGDIEELEHALKQATTYIRAATPRKTQVLAKIGPNAEMSHWKRSSFLVC